MDGSLDHAVYEAKVKRWDAALAAVYSALQHNDSVVWADLGRQLRDLMTETEVGCLAISLLRALPEDEALKLAHLALGGEPGAATSIFVSEAYPGEAAGNARFLVDAMSNLYRREVMKALWTALTPKDRERFMRWAEKPRQEARNG
jgi:hypothetical protein